MKENHGPSEEDKISGKNISPSTPHPPPPKKKNWFTKCNGWKNFGD